MEQLPGAAPHGNFQPDKVVTGEPTFITLDLETTDLIRGGIMPHITQIAAADIKSNTCFAVYCKPKVPICSEVQKITGISLNDDGDMVVNGRCVESLDIKLALEQLCTWLLNFKTSKLYIIAHNGQMFDMPVLMTALKKTGTINSFLKAVSGCIDSLKVFRKKFPNRSHKQKDLVFDLLGMTYESHNAEGDVKALGKLVNLCESSELLSASFSPLAVINTL
ncbi:unnamed protein product [Owenia fusiformis]|uniref:Uncharacterized protein n=1 Tax=Owenia fusiformis TaxID=6347 RepID=A0A8J1TBB7_OWEFU|nr:unnamed protein product [Owenia fusiformis]